MPRHQGSKQLFAFLLLFAGMPANAVLAADESPKVEASNPTEATEAPGLGIVEDADDVSDKLIQIEAKMGFYPSKAIGAAVGYDLDWVAFEVAYLKKFDNFGHLSNRRTFEEYAANAKFFFADELFYIKTGLGRVDEDVEKVKSGWEAHGSAWSTLLGVGSRWRMDSLYLDVEWAAAAFPIQYEKKWKSRQRFTNKDPNAQDYQDWKNEVSKHAPDSDRQLTLGVGVTF